MVNDFRELIEGISKSTNKFYEQRKGKDRDLYVESI